MKEHVLVCGQSFLKRLKLLNLDWWLLRMSVESFQRQHMATWNNASGVWVTDQVNLLCAHSVLFLATWPVSGMTLNGVAFELPMPVRPITVSGSSSSPILPTLKARDSQAEGYEAGLRRAMPQVGTIVKGIVDGDPRVMDVPEESLFRTPQAKEGEGGAVFEDVKRDRGNHVMVRDQVAQLAHENGLPVSEGMAMLPTPAVGHIRNHDEPIDDYLARRAKADSGEYRGMPGVSLGVAVRMEMLPTPNTMEHREIKTPEQIAELKAKSPGGYRNLRESVINDLLPTPIVRDYKDGSAEVLRDGEVQVDTVARAIFNSGEVLLGTPRTSSANAATTKQIDAGAPKSRLEDQVELPTTSWGKFQPAITRWEQVLGRPAPAPTKPDGKDGSHRLSSAFTEWMMGLPEGWITGVGLTRVEELKACGNGVVPQQAEMALRMLLEGVELEV